MVKLALQFEFSVVLSICGFLFSQVDFGEFNYKKLWNAANPLAVGNVVLKFASSNFLPIGETVPNKMLNVYFE